MKESDWLYVCMWCFAMGVFAVLGWQIGIANIQSSSVPAWVRGTVTGMLAAEIIGGLGVVVYHLAGALDRALLAFFRWYIKRAKEA